MAFTHGRIRACAIPETTVYPKKNRGAHAQKHSPRVTNKGEPGKVLTRAPCAKIYCLGP